MCYFSNGCGQYECSKFAVTLHQTVYPVLGVAEPRGVLIARWTVHKSIGVATAKLSQVNCPAHHMHALLLFRSVWERGSVGERRGYCLCAKPQQWVAGKGRKEIILARLLSLGQRRMRGHREMGDDRMG